MFAEQNNVGIMMELIEYENLYRANLPFFREFQECFQQTLNSGWFILGKNVERFEQKFTDYLGCRFCVGVASGMAALQLSLRALDLPKDSEVIVPSNTYIATILAVVNEGLKPVLVEPDIRTYNIDPGKIEEKLNEKTKAILVVHLYGKSCEMEPVLEIAKRHGLKVIEDCAQAHGAEYMGKKVGTFGDLAALASTPPKTWAL